MFTVIVLARVCWRIDRVTTLSSMACSIWDCPYCVVKARQYELTDADVRLKTALQDWRRNQYLSTVGYENMYGPQLIMTDDILERFVELAHFEEVSDLASIHTQVSWRYIDRRVHRFLMS
ncbi:hypothetical protein EDB89DRAFT_265453 [Lactarius sanguifluus]|nr:hypothetical protein EDB89DRAFT_265453 [Lactarius sanguifluus]